MNRILAAAFAALALLVVGPVGSAEASAKHVVLVQNKTDDASRARAGVHVAPAAGDTVDSENLAYAKASCTDCRTVAVAMQVVLITSDASTVTPKNAAVAVNESCLRCETMAAAYQYVVTTGGPVRISEEGRQRIAQVRQQASAVAASGLPFPEIDAKLDALFAELKDAIDDEVVRVGRTPSGTASADAETA